MLGKNRIVKNDRVYIDDTLMTYKVADEPQYIGGEMKLLKIFYYDEKTGETIIKSVDDLSKVRKF